MSKFIIVGLLLIVAIIFFYQRSIKGKKRVVVLGQEMADASEKERQRVNAGNFDKSPLPDFGYAKWPDEQSLINPIENELDLKIKAVCSEYEHADVTKRQSIRNSIDQDQIYTLLEFSKRSIIFGIRKNQSSYIDDALVAVSMIESERCDYRDVLVTLEFLEYGMQKLNLDIPTFFDKSIKLSEGKTADIFKKHSERSPTGKKSVTVGGYVPLETANGISFISSYYEKYAPKTNLVEILFRFSDFIFKDKYRKGDITVGNKISAIWLNADNDKTIEQYISMASGCASLSAYLKDNIHPESKVQNLNIYLAEFENKKDLQILYDQANNTEATKFSRLSFVEGNIFCLVIQRAVMAGVEDYETNERLKRFEIPLREIIKKETASH